jgi:anti-sigma regulatory factor (Ser/Thr protein kinase)
MTSRLPAGFEQLGDCSPGQPADLGLVSDHLVALAADSGRRGDDVPALRAEVQVVTGQLARALAAARQARSAVRRALAAWGVHDPSGDAELLASELVANAAGHARGPISLALRRHAEPGTLHGITCEVTDTSLGLPRPRQAGPDDERGRGMAIVAALASGSGVRAGPAGKTTWFTLALHDRPGRVAARAAPEPELEAGA